MSVLISCLTGRALEWANAVWNGPDSAREHYPEFSLRFRAVFDHPLDGLAVGERLFLSQAGEEERPGLRAGVPDLGSRIWVERQGPYGPLQV